MSSLLLAFYPLSHCMWSVYSFTQVKFYDDKHCDKNIYGVRIDIELQFLLINCLIAWH